MAFNQMNRGGIERPVEDNEQRIRNMGDRVDFEVESVMSIELPEGRFSENMLNRMVDTLNKFGPMMGFEDLERVSGEQSRMPMELVQMTMAIAGAAEDAEIALDIDLSEIEADRDLAKVVGQLDKLSKNSSFKEFLEEEMYGEFEDEEAVERVDEEVDEEVVEEVAADEIDTMFARRM